jgi:hypothetical protein
MLDVLNTSMIFVFIFYSKLPPTSKSKVEDGKHIDANKGKGQDHNTKNSLSISRAKFDNMSDLVTPGDIKVLSTYVTHPCDNQEPDTHLVGYTIIDVGVIMPNS